MFKTLFGLVTSNPYIAGAIALAVIGLFGSAAYYVHHQNATIAGLQAIHEADQKANGALATQKASLEATVADQQTVIAKQLADAAASQAAVADAQADKAAAEAKLSQVTAHANAAPPSDDGLVSPLLAHALSELCNARAGSSPAGCGV